MHTTLQELNRICGEKGDSLGLTFSSDKSGVMVLNNQKREPPKIQGSEIDHIEKYKYVSGSNEENIIGKGNKVQLL